MRIGLICVVSSLLVASQAMDQGTLFLAIMGALYGLLVMVIGIISQ